MKQNISIDYKSPIPIYKQIKQAIKMQIINGDYKEGDRLISIRELAQTLQINQNTIVKAYYQLDIEGFIHSKPGRGYFINKIEHNNTNLNHELFKELSDEYLNRITRLGFSIQDIITYLENSNK